MYSGYISAEDDSKPKNRGHQPRMPPDRRPGSALSRGRAVLEEHGGYFCAGCKRSWSSLVSLNHHRASPYMRGTACEEEDNSRELRNIFRANLATGQDSRPPELLAGIVKVAVNIHKRIHLAKPKSYRNVLCSNLY